MDPNSNIILRAGAFVKQEGGFKAFIPTKLPPNPPLHRDDEIDELLSRADRSIGRLDGVCSTLPNPDLFVAMYVRYEAVLSSQIEGTQSTLEDVLEYESDSKASEEPKDAAEVINYVAAMNHGLDRLEDSHLACVSSVKSIASL